MNARRHVTGDAEEGVLYPGVLSLTILTPRPLLRVSQRVQSPYLRIARKPMIAATVQNKAVFAMMTSTHQALVSQSVSKP